MVTFANVKAFFPCRILSIVAPDCKNVFEAYARIFVGVKALTPVICVHNI